MFGLRDKVRIKNGPQVYTIEEIRQVDDGKLYSIQPGADFASRQWKNGSEIVLVGKAKLIQDIASNSMAGLTSRA
jgi:hypothetical protein